MLDQHIGPRTHRAIYTALLLALVVTIAAAALMTVVFNRALQPVWSGLCTTLFIPVFALLAITALLVWSGMQRHLKKVLMILNSTLIAVLLALEIPLFSFAPATCKLMQDSMTPSLEWVLVVSATLFIAVFEMLLHILVGREWRLTEHIHAEAVVSAFAEHEQGGRFTRMFSWLKLHHVLYTVLFTAAVLLAGFTVYNILVIAMNSESVCITMGCLAYAISDRANLSTSLLWPVALISTAALVLIWLVMFHRRQSVYRPAYQPSLFERHRSLFSRFKSPTQAPVASTLTTDKGGKTSLKTVKKSAVSKKAHMKQKTPLRAVHAVPLPLASTGFSASRGLWSRIVDAVLSAVKGFFSAIAGFFSSVFGSITSGLKRRSERHAEPITEEPKTGKISKLREAESEVSSLLNRIADTKKSLIEDVRGNIDTASDERKGLRTEAAEIRVRLVGLNREIRQIARDKADLTRSSGFLQTKPVQNELTEDEQGDIDQLLQKVQQSIQEMEERTTEAETEKRTLAKRLKEIQTKRRILEKDLKHNRRIEQQVSRELRKDEQRLRKHNRKKSSGV
ncbi:hypothetical protein KY362_00105 [Candidatus Woesearchaeota archaeon]|nr:hypothetical protein [Candidatus Woesearchaeota archaeon]